MRCFSPSSSLPGVEGVDHSSSARRASIMSFTARSGELSSSAARLTLPPAHAMRVGGHAPETSSGSLCSSTSHTGHTHTSRSSSCRGKPSTALRCAVERPRHQPRSSAVSMAAMRARSAAVGRLGGGAASSARPSVMTELI